MPCSLKLIQYIKYLHKAENYPTEPSRSDSEYGKQVRMVPTKTKFSPSPACTINPHFNFLQIQGFSEKRRQRRRGECWPQVWEYACNRHQIQTRWRENINYGTTEFASYRRRMTSLNFTPVKTILALSSPPSFCWCKGNEGLFSSELLLCFHQQEQTEVCTNYWITKRNTLRSFEVANVADAGLQL